MGRSHLVLVPGFGGFDALGQMHYYTRVVERAPAHLALHFFDNLPTAGVATRGRELIGFIEKLIERGIIRDDDQLTLLGHSTGGLDIRWALHEWERRALVRGVVFMSVPHHGTNIADFVDAHGKLSGLLRFGLKHAPYLAGAAITLVKRLHELDDSQLVTLAIDDVKAELVEQDDRWLAAQARRAAGELALWRVQMASDFAAIDDLKTGAFSVDLPAGIECLSFATIAPNPFDRPLEADRGIRDLDTALALARDHAAHPDQTDALFRLAYAACSAGPFERSATIRWLPDYGVSQPAEIQPWDNDGIVNTASMVWGDTWLVRGDHADIIGHYHEWKKPQPTGRQYEAYDLLRSGSRFGEDRFHAVWDHVFAFASRV